MPVSDRQGRVVGGGLGDGVGERGLVVQRQRYRPHKIADCGAGQCQVTMVMVGVAAQVERTVSHHAARLDHPAGPKPVMNQNGNDGKNGNDGNDGISASHVFTLISGGKFFLKHVFEYGRNHVRATRENQQPNTMKCPVCTAPDLVMADRQGVEIEYCPKCRGVGLDQ